jgi:hypothetical protein
MSEAKAQPIPGTAPASNAEIASAERAPESPLVSQPKSAAEIISETAETVIESLRAENASLRAKNQRLADGFDSLFAEHEALKARIAGQSSAPVPEPPKPPETAKEPPVDPRLPVRRPPDFRNK